MPGLTRRDFMQLAGVSALSPLLNTVASMPENQITSTGSINSEKGKQRLSLEQLNVWEKLGYGMFIHFGMSTFDEDEFSKGDKPAGFYNPVNLDVTQWIDVAREAGMKYAVLTAKHVAGHCLWPTRHSNYHVGNSGNKTDVVAAFVKACNQKGILPGL